MSKLEYRLSNVAYNSNENPLVDERTLVVIVNPECVVLPDDYLFALWTEHLVAFFDAECIDEWLNVLECYVNAVDTE